MVPGLRNDPHGRTESGRDSAVTDSVVESPCELDPTTVVSDVLETPPPIGGRDEVLHRAEAAHQWPGIAERAQSRIDPVNETVHCHLVQQRDHLPGKAREVLLCTD